MHINLFSLASLLLSFTCAAIIVILLLFGHNRLSRVWLFANLTIGTWGIGAFFLGQASDPANALFWWKVGQIGVILIPIAFIHLVHEFCGINNRKVVTFAYLQGFVFLLLLLFNKLTGEASLIFNSFYYPKANLPLYLIYFLVWISLTVYVAVKLLLAHQVSHGYKRLQLSYVLFSSIIGFLGGITNFLPALRIMLYPFGNLIIPIFCFLITYAALQYKLIDFRVALVRTGIFVTLYALIVIFLYNLSLEQQLWKYSPWITLFIASAGPFILMYLIRKTEALVLKEDLRHYKSIRELSGKMTRMRTLPELFKAINTSLVESIELSFSAIYLKEPVYKSYQLKHFFPQEARFILQGLVPAETTQLIYLNNKKKPMLSEELRGLNIHAGLVIPFIIDDELIGFMLLGQKPRHHSYTSDDIIAFESFSYSASLAIENCRFWKEIEERQRKARLQEMDTYSYSLAHEIDNPMQVILGEGWLLKNDVLREIREKRKLLEASESFDFIIEAAQRVSGMVKAIREFGQPTTGQFIPLALEEVVDSFEKLYYPPFKANTVVFEKIDKFSDSAWINGEKPALMQVLVILASNSIHAMKDRKDKRVTLTVEPINHEWVRMTFADNGYGIKPDMMDLIFSPFTTTKASSEGTGMGLYNAKMIIEHHKGRIWAESEGEDKGASFVIELPLTEEPGVKVEERTRRLY